MTHLEGVQQDEERTVVIRTAEDGTLTVETEIEETVRSSFVQTQSNSED